MSAALEKSWTVEQFFAWAERQEGRHELDNGRPVAMVGGTMNHAVIMRNLHRALDSRLRGSRCQPLGPDAGVAINATTVRYPDALVTCSHFAGTARTAPGVVAIFEIVSPTSGRIDRITKVREYAAVSSIRQYVVLESSTAGLQVLIRQGDEDPWKLSALTADEVLHLPEIGIQIPVAEFYEGVDFGDDGQER